MRRNRLTAREIQILKLVGAGYEYKEIARQLNIRTCTVQSAMTSVMLKLDTPNRTNAVVAALKKTVIIMEQIPDYDLD